jgi:co-chaperonin GroES (HSP10)
MSYTPVKGKIKPIRDNVFVTEMDFGEMQTSSGIIVRSDDGKAHGVKPRWGKVYAVGPEQDDVSIGQWILIEHGRWTRKIVLDDGESIKNIHRVDPECILMISDEAPAPEDVVINDSL